jgi:predicted nucleotidyltransferase
MIGELDRQDRVAEPHHMNRDERPAAYFVAALASEIQGVLGDDLVGLYLYGSSVTGGFDPGVSDIDLVAVTSPEVEALDLAGLEQMHRRFVSRYPEWSDRLEIVYIGRATLESFRTSPGSLAVISPGEPFHVRDERVADWLQNWYLVRETGICLYGADAAAIVPPIAWTEFVAATVGYADEVRNRSRLRAGGGDLAYTVLTMCRALRTVRTQTHGSKQEAAAWTRERMPEWVWLIDTALTCRLSRGTVGFEDERSRAAAETFIALLDDEILGRATNRL